MLLIPLHKFVRLFCLPVCLMFSAGWAYASSFRHLNIEDGLSSRQVLQVGRDSTGFAWFFTQSGVDRYDGSEFRHYPLDGNLYGNGNLPSATRMVCDGNGNIRIATQNGRIYAYDRAADKFVLCINLSDHFRDSEISLHALMFDRDNRLWLCLSSGLYCFDFEANRPVLAHAFGGEPVSAIARGNGDELFVGTYGSVYRLEKEADGYSAKRIPGIPGMRRVESLLFHGSKLYVGTLANGVHIVDFDAAGTVSTAHFIPGVPVRAIVAASGNRILVGTDGSGFYSMDAASNRLLQWYAADENTGAGPADNTVCDIFVDRDDRIWIATSTNGVSILDPNLPDVLTVRHVSGNPDSPVSDHVNVLLEDSDGDMWYGTNNGVSVQAARDGSRRHFPDKRTGAVVLALCEDADGNIWAGGYGIGAWRIDKRSGKVQKLDIRRENPTAGLSTPYIYAIYADGDEVWFGGIEGELTRYNVRTKEFAYFPVGCIGDIKSGEGRTLLIATCAGLTVFDRDTGRDTLFNRFGGIPLGDPVRSLCRSSSGDVWLAGGNNGLIRFRPATGDSEIFTPEENNARNPIISVLEDDRKRIWFASENGLYRIDPQSGAIVSVDGYIGAGDRTYNANAAVKRRNGNPVFGTANGTVEFSPDFTPDEPDSARLVFTDFKISYKSAAAGEPGAPLQKAIDQTRFIPLKYAQNTFSVSFSAICFRQAHKIRYECMLDGLEDQWHEAEGRTDYTNIAPGRYELRVRAVNRYTKTTLDERSIRITVGRPWWTSVGAFAVYVLLLAGGALLTVKFIKARMEERDSREKIDFFTNVAHDIRTPVMLIKAPLNDLEGENLTAYGRETLATAMRNAEKLFSLITQLLDFRKADLAETGMTVSECELYSFMNEKVAMFQPAARQKDITLTLTTDFNLLKVYFDREKMNRIMDNLLSNAVKYTPAGGSVTVVLAHAGESWSAEVRDTGIGIPAADRKHLFKLFYRASNAANSEERGSGVGLLLVRKLVTLHHGEVQFSSAENKGSVFKITIPTGKAPQDGTTDKRTEAAPLREKILLAEDNDDMRAYLKSSLTQEYSVTDLPDGRTAAEKIAEINPDIVILDVLMPFLRGDEICRTLKSNVETSHIPVILLTALNDRENIITGLESGADDYITKPFDTAVLKARIRNILQNRDKLRKAISSGNLSAEAVVYANELDRKFIDKTMAFINKRMSEFEFSINELCMEMGMSRSSFYNKLKTLTGQAPNDFIRTIRLNKARELLRSGRCTVSEASLMVGFADAKYFSTSFKKQFGISPSKV